MPSALPLVMTATRAVADAVHAARGASKPPPASATPATTAASGGALLAARRALALRLLFDTSAADVLARWYRRRTAPLARTLRRRGFLRLHDLVRDPPLRAAAWVSLAALLAFLYHRRNRARWAVEREYAPLRAAIQSRLDDAASYEEFKRAALDMEALEERVAVALASAAGAGAVDAARPANGAAGGLWSRGQPTYDRELIEEQLRALRAQRASGNVEEMMFGLRANILRNLGNMSEVGRHLHEPLWGVPRAMREYIDETRAQLRVIAQEHDVPIQEKLAFLQETRHCFGRAALLMSGGGTLGTFHVGVARALNARGCLPRVLVGSSVGSIVAAIMASRTPDELDEFFSDEHFWDLLPDMTFFSGRDFFSSIQHLVRTGALHDIDFFQRCLRALLGDLTFQEAYDRSGGRILCVCVCATRTGEKPRLLNYLTSPHLVVWSAVAASCAFPSLFPPQPLLAKSRNGAFVPWQPEGKLGPRRWRDGSLENDLPMQGLSELFNVNYFIVSQTNPHIVPILRVKRWFAARGPFCATLAAFLESEWRHRCRQILDLVPWVDAFDFAKLFGQEWEGNVTVVMAYSWKQFKQIAANPTREFLYETATMGEREMWPKLATIESNCGIEMQLDECVRVLREKLSARQGFGLKQRGRVPSWNTVNFCSRDSYLRMPQGSASAAGDDAWSSGAGSLGLGLGIAAGASASAAAAAGSDGGPSRSSSAGSLSEFVAVVAAEEERVSRLERERGRGERANANANANAKGDGDEDDASDPSPYDPSAVVTKQNSWPLGQKMPTALMKIGRVRVGGSAELLPETRRRGDGGSPREGSGEERRSGTGGGARGSPRGPRPPHHKSPLHPGLSRTPNGE